MRIARVFAGFAFLLAAQSAIAGEVNIFKDLPGVLPQKQLAPPPSATDNADCRSRIASPYYDRYGARGMPIRVYSCENGPITYESTLSPNGNPPKGDPYVHGEGNGHLPGFSD